MMEKEISLVKNSVYNVAYRLLNVFFPLISSVYISHLLLASGVGKISYAQNIVTYFTTFAALGLPNYGVREIAKIRNNGEKTNKLFSELFYINAIATFICIVIYILLILSIPRFYNDLSLYLVMGLQIIFNLINVDWFFQGKEEYQYITIRSFIVKVCSLVALLVFVRSKEDVVVYATILSLATGGNYIFNIFRLNKYKVKLQKIDITFTKHIKPIIIMLGTTIAIELYTLLDTTMIGIFCTDEYVGYYSNTMKLVRIVITVVTAIGATLLPRLSYYYVLGKHKECEKIVNKVFTIMLFIFVPCEIGIYLCSNEIILVLFGESFSPAITTLKIASFLICTLGFSNLFGTQILLTYGMEKKLFYSTLVGAGINVSLNLVLIPLYQQNGAAVASVVSEAIVTIMTSMYAKKYIKIKISLHFMISIIVATLMMSLSLIGLKNIVHLNLYLNLIIAVLVGASVYMFVNVITCNPILRDFYKYILQKVGRGID